MNESAEIAKWIQEQLWQYEDLREDFNPRYSPSMVSTEGATFIMVDRMAVQYEVSVRKVSKCD